MTITEELPMDKLRMESPDMTAQNICFGLCEKHKLY